MANMMNGTLWRFVLVGVANSAIGYAVVMWMHYGLGAAPLLANTIGYVVGGLVSYLLHRSFTFGSKRAHGSALPLFIACAAMCFALNAAVLELCLRGLQLPFPIAQASAMVAYTGLFYFLNRHLVFPHPAAAPREP